MADLSRRNALVASAQLLTGKRHQDPSKQRRAWQAEAWQFYDETGPLRYATNWLSNLVSRARLQAAQQTNMGDEPEPISDGPAAEAVGDLAGNTSNQSQMLKSAAVHLTVPGESYLVGQGKKVNTWRMYSADVLRIARASNNSSAAIYELAENEGQWVPLEPDSLVVKVWRPHERIHWEPDSPARVALGDLRELRRIRQYIDATLVSRLSGAGIVVIPTEASFPTASTAADDENEDPPHPFITEILDVMMTAIKEPGSAAQVVPIPVEIPGEYVDSFKHLSFATELSDKILDMRESALRQCAITLDVPAEVLTGMGEVNHWGSWQIEESAVKIFAEPLLELITSALTQGFLHPVLKAQGMAPEEAETYVVWADTSELSSKPDKSDDALALYDRGEASGEALRRETGLSESDKPSGEELAEWAYKRLVGEPTLATIGMEGLGIKVPVQAPPPLPEVEEMASESSNNDDGESRSMPDTQDDAPFDTRTVLVLEGFVTRALERAGNRLRSQFKSEESIKGCEADLVHTCLGGTDLIKVNAYTLLAGCWARLPEVAAELGLDQIQAVHCLEEFCATLLSKGYAYDRSHLENAISTIKPDRKLVAV